MVNRQRFCTLAAIAAFLTFSLHHTSVAGSEGNTFDSPTLGLRVTKPNAWHFMSVDQNLENLRRTEIGDAEFQQLLLRHASAPLVVMTKYPEPFDDLNPSLKVNIRPFGQLMGTDAKDMLKLVSAQFSRIFEDYEVVQPPKDTTMSGFSAGYMRVNYTLRTADGTRFPTTSELWIVPRGDYFFMLGSGTRQDEKTGTRSEIQAIVDSIEIAS